MKKIDDIFNLLQHQQPAISNPDELTDSIMDSLPDLNAPKGRSTSRYRLYIVSAVAIAASILLLLVFDMSPAIDDKATVISKRNQKGIQQTAIQTATEIRSTNTELPVTTTSKREAPTKRGVTRQAKKDSRPLAVPNRTASSVDSLDYYIAKIERELAKVDDSLYIERMQKVIQADERLQRIVNSYILHQLDKEGCPLAAMNTNNVTTEKDEE